MNTRTEDIGMNERAEKNSVNKSSTGLRSVNVNGLHLSEDLFFKITMSMMNDDGEERTETKNKY